MKILYTNFHYGDGGGHTTYIVSLARALHGQHTLHVAAPADSRLLRTVAEEGIATPLPMALAAACRPCHDNWPNSMRCAGWCGTRASTWSTSTVLVITAS